VNGTRIGLVFVTKSYGYLLRFLENLWCKTDSLVMHGPLGTTPIEAQGINEQDPAPLPFTGPQIAKVCNKVGLDFLQESVDTDV
jgi:hypothetical protein